jgi:hypothetical protein
MPAKALDQASELDRWHTRARAADQVPHPRYLELGRGNGHRVERGRLGEHN